MSKKMVCDICKCSLDYERKYFHFPKPSYRFKKIYDDIMFDKSNFPMDMCERCFYQFIKVVREKEEVENE